MFVVVSYDVVDDKRRTKMCETLKGFGAHVQYSVFECNLKADDFKRLRQKLKPLIKVGEDQVRYYFLCESCVERAIVDGKGGLTQESLFRIVKERVGKPS